MLQALEAKNKPFLRFCKKSNVKIETRGQITRGSLTSKGVSMNRNDATRILARLIGKNFAWREDPKALTGEAREAAEAEYHAARRALDEARKAREARQVEVLAADAEYQRLREAVRAQGVTVSKLSGKAHAYRITVGANLGWAFSVDAQGDNWQDVVDQVRGKKSKA